jgi:hypothetical protein
MLYLFVTLLTSKSIVLGSSEPSLGAYSGSIGEARTFWAPALSSSGNSL